MQTINDSSSHQDSDTPVAFYLFIGMIGLFVLGMVLYIIFAS